MKPPPSDSMKLKFSKMEMTTHEDYLIRALTSSISFGRYVVSHEPFHQEKLSGKRNKYSKEAEKISKPGSVARLKAYFESYHHKIASNKIVDGTIYVDQGLVSEGTTKTTHDLNNINGEEGNELVNMETRVTHDLSRNVEGSEEMQNTVPMVDHSAPIITTFYTYNHRRHTGTDILGIEDHRCRLLRRISKSSSSKEKKKVNINSSKSNNSSIKGRSTPIAANQDTSPPPLTQIKKDSSTSATHFIKSRITKNFVGSKNPSSSSVETVVGSSKHGSKQKSRSSINGASIRPPWR